MEAIIDEQQGVVNINNPLRVAKTDFKVDTEVNFISELIFSFLLEIFTIYFCFKGAFT